MSSDYLPARDADLAQWTGNFRTLTTANPAIYGMTALQALAYATADAIWQTALAVAVDPPTRTAPNVAAKDAAKANVTSVTRQMASVVQAYPSITNTLLGNLGLTIRSTTRPPTPPPSTFPILSIMSAQGMQLITRIADQNTPDLRGRPVGTAGAEIWWSRSNATPPVAGLYEYFALNTRQPGVFTYDAADVGKTAFFKARWINRKGEVGPWSGVSQQILA